MSMRDFKRPASVRAMKRTPPRTRTAAATELARLEFERERLEREQQIILHRDQIIKNTLERIERRSSVLYTKLQFERSQEPREFVEDDPALVSDQAHVRGRRRR